MEDQNALEISNVTKAFTIEIEDPEKNKSILNRHITKCVTHTVLNDISFNVRKGEIIGILGKNGSGKSTLLSLIARILEPDSGTITRFGKIASILELGMGFHGDMSGRENIYLKGELYGLSKKDIDSRIDGIIEYSGLRDYIDNPVRTYSSGMSGRLAFSIMVNVESDIMLVDEVISVGDAAFEIKSKEHFRNMAKSGKTIIIVSHQTSYLESFCTRIIWLKDGRIYRDGKPKDVCAEYQNQINELPEIVQDLANAGVPEAQYKLYHLYKNGEYFEQNVELAQSWLKCAAEHGHIRAQVDYADHLMSTGAKEEALNYYVSAANKGDADAKMRVASLQMQDDLFGQKLKDLYIQADDGENGLIEFRLADIVLKTALTPEDRKYAFELFCKSANNGFPNAFHQLGIMYRDGLGVSRNLDKMEEYLLKGANAGYAPSITYLSDVYIQGRLRKKDEKKSFEMALKAAKLGNAGFMYRVATYYRDGVGTPRNMEQADYWFGNYSKSGLVWYAIAAADYLRPGNIETDLDLLTLYDVGTIFMNAASISNAIQQCFMLKKPYKKYLEKMEYLAQNNNVDSLRRLAGYYYEGLLVEKNYPRAIEFYTVAAKLGDVWSMNRLGEMYRDGKGVPVDIEISEKYFRQAARSGNISAIISVLTLCNAKIDENSETFTEFLNYLEANAKFYNLDALKRLGNYYYDGIGVKQNRAKALIAYENAALLGDSWAKLRVGEMYREGIGTDRNENKSIEWFVKRY